MTNKSPNRQAEMPTLEASGRRNSRVVGQHRRSSERGGPPHGDCSKVHVGNQKVNRSSILDIRTCIITGALFYLLICCKGNTWKNHVFNNSFSCREVFVGRRPLHFTVTCCMTSPYLSLPSQRNCRKHP